MFFNRHELRIMAAEKRAGKNKAAANKNRSAEENPASELNAPRWSVVSFEKRVAKNLLYAEAVEKLAQFRARKISGLCVVTDEAAARIAVNGKR